MSPAAFSTAVSWMQVGLGSVMLVRRFRGTDESRITGPYGTWFVVAGVLRLLQGRIPETVHQTMLWITIVVVAVWAYREHRARRAQRREAARMAGTGQT